jgi:hypothetical protein
MTHNLEAFAGMRVMRILDNDLKRLLLGGMSRVRKGQLMKTALKAGGLGLGRLAMRLLGLGPQAVADNLRNWRPLPGLGDNLDAAIQDDPLCRVALKRGLSLDILA